MNRLEKYNNQYRSHVDFILGYRKAKNAATGSKFDSNANVENKNITTCSGELTKGEKIGTNRLLMIDKITEMYGSELAEEYIRQLEQHEIYKHDETSIAPYCVSITMYPFLFEGLKGLGGISDAPTNLDSFCGSFNNLVFAIAAQFAGAVSTPEFLMYMDYFIRKDYGDDYLNRLNDRVTAPFVLRQRTLKQLIEDKFQGVVHTLNQPAAARDYQSVFWNIAYFDKPYFGGMFDNFVFPDGTKPNWETVNWLQKDFMDWFNKERLKKVLTFPVETVNLLDNGTTYVDTEWEDYVAEMYSQGHSFFTYRSNSVDSLASCCFDGKQMTLTKSSNGVNYMSFEDLYNAPSENKRNFTVFHNGSWVKGKIVQLPKRDLYKITTANKKEIFITDNHINPTLNGDKKTTDLTNGDYLLFNNLPLDTFPEKDKHLTYEQGYLIGMYLGDGSIDQKEDHYMPIVHLSLNEEKYNKSLIILQTAIKQITYDSNVEVLLGQPYNHVYPVMIKDRIVTDFIREYVFNKYAFDKELNLECLLQSKIFRQGILDGYYLTDGGNSNRIYTTSSKLVEHIECLITSLGYCSVIDVTDRTDEKVVIRGSEYQRNYPLYCIRWYDPKNKRSMNDVFKIKNNSVYFKITSIEPINNTFDHVYCFEMSNTDEPYFTLPNGIITHNCRLRNEVKDNTFSFTLGAGGVSTGSKGVITTNVNRLVQNAVKNHKDISEAMREQTIKNHKYLTAFNEVIKDSFNAKMLSVYEAGYIALEKQYLTLGINGFVEGAEFLGIDISPNEKYFDYGEMILKPIFEENKKAKTKDLMFNTEFVPAENLGVKNAKWDKEDGYFVPRDCYNSYFYLVEDNTVNLIDKFVLHGSRLTKYLDGGSALHGNLSEHLSKDQYLNLLRVAIKTGCSYFTFNVPNTICNECGFISKHKLSECPKCHSKNLDFITRVIGFIKRVSSFSEARQKEESKRHYEKPQI